MKTLLTRDRFKDDRALADFQRELVAKINELIAGPEQMTTTARDAITFTPRTGQVIYNTTTNRLNYWNGTAWKVVEEV